MDKHSQVTLRVRQDSEMDRFIKRLSEGQMTDQQMRDFAGSAWGADVFRRFCQNFDNLKLVRNRSNKQNKLVYADPNPTVPVAVGVSVSKTTTPSATTTAGDGAAVSKSDLMSLVDALKGNKAQDEDFSNIKWPQCPPLCEPMPNFREPSWFQVMKAMVAQGKHIALSGPPGVGKDTAVIQLASEEGRPLVTIGGDAGFRRRDLVGTAHIVNGSSYIEVGEYAAAAINGWWVLLTEVNAADADALMYINAQLAAPYIVTISGKAYPVHPDFRIFVSYNPGLVGTKPLPQSFKDRFFSIQVPFFTADGLRKVLEAHGLPKVDEVRKPEMQHTDWQGNITWDITWVEQIIKFGTAMWEAYEAGRMRYQITTRRLIDATVLMNEGIVDSFSEAIKAAVLAAIDSPVEYKAAQEVLKSITR